MIFNNDNTKEKAKNIKAILFDVDGFLQMVELSMTTMDLNTKDTMSKIVKLSLILKNLDL